MLFELFVWVSTTEYYSCVCKEVWFDDFTGVMHASLEVLVVSSWDYLNKR